MNKNLVGILIIAAALGLFFFYGWPKLQPYLAPPPTAPAQTGSGETPNF